MPWTFLWPKIIRHCIACTEVAHDDMVTLQASHVSMAIHQGEGFGVAQYCEAQSSPCKIISCCRCGFKLTWRANYRMKHRGELNIWETPHSSGVVVSPFLLHGIHWTSHKKSFKVCVRVNSIKRKMLEKSPYNEINQHKKAPTKYSQIIDQNFLWFFMALKKLFIIKF